MSNQDSSTYMEARKNNIRPEETVTAVIREKNGDDIKEIIGLITTDLIYTGQEKYLKTQNDIGLLYGKVHINYSKNGELEIHCIRNMRGGAFEEKAENFILHIKQGSGENADITIEANGPSSTDNKDFLLRKVQEYAYPLNEIVTAANEMYKNLTQPPVAVAPVAVAPPKSTNASTPAPGSVAARIALLNKKGGRRSRRKGRKSHKSRKSHKKSRRSNRSQRRQ